MTERNRWPQLANSVSLFQSVKCYIRYGHSRSRYCTIRSRTRGCVSSLRVSSSYSKVPNPQNFPFTIQTCYIPTHPTLRNPEWDPHPPSIPMIIHVDSTELAPDADPRGSHAHVPAIGRLSTFFFPAGNPKPIASLPHENMHLGKGLDLFS